MKIDTPYGDVTKEDDGNYCVWDETQSLVCRTPYLIIAEAANRMYGQFIMNNVETRREKVVIVADKHSPKGIVTSLVSLVNIKGYVQISDVIEVDFPLLNDGVVLAARVQAIDNEIERAQEVVYMLQRERQELLALTHNET